MQHPWTVYCYVNWLTVFSIITDQDPSEEECEEGYSVLLDGLWRFWNWYCILRIYMFMTVADVCLAGRTTFVNTLCGRKVLSHKESDDPTIAHVEEGVKIKPITVGKL